PASAPEGLIGAHATPCCPGVVGAEYAALTGDWGLGPGAGGVGAGGWGCWVRHETVHHGVDAARIRRRDRDAGPPDPGGRQAGRELLPRPAGVGGLVN